MAPALSVWARKPHEVVLVVYTFWMLVLLLSPIWYALAWLKLVGPPADWSLLANPYYLAFAPYSAPGRFDLWDYLAFFAATLGAAVALVGSRDLEDAARREARDQRKSQATPARLGSAGRRGGCPARRSTAIPCSGASGIGRGRRGGRRSWVCWWAARPGAACAVGAVSALIGGLDERAAAVPVELIVGADRASLACLADRGSLRRDPAVDLRPADACGRGADVDGRGKAARQPGPPGRNHALHTGDRRGQVARGAASSCAGGDRAGIAGIRPGPGREGPADVPGVAPGPVPRGIVRRCVALRCLPAHHDDPRSRRLDREHRAGARRLDRARAGRSA